MSLQRLHIAAPVGSLPLHPVSSNATAGRTMHTSCTTHRLRPFSTTQHRCRTQTAFAAQQDREGTAAPSSGDNDDDGDLAIESQLSRRRSALAKRRRPVPSITPAQRATQQAKEEPTSQTEALVLQSLGVAFVLILLEGLILAGSGFLPEEIDNFIVDYVYPSFSIQVGVVFACSTVYGLWKTSTTKK